MRQLTIDGRQEDIPERHERMKLFEAPGTMKGQLPMPEPKPEPHRCEIVQSTLGRGGHVHCVTCGWESLWQPTCVMAAELAEDHQDYYA